MTTLAVYDPAMCCSTGICGVDIDQRLVDLAADLDWLRAQGVTVRRFGLSREPAEFAANAAIRAIMQDSAGDDLPVFMVDGVVRAKGRYPGRAELAAWTGVAAPSPSMTDQMRALVALGAAVGAGCETCLTFHTARGRELGLSDAQMREAVAVGRMVKAAAAAAVEALAGKLLPEPAAASSCCGPAREAVVPAVATGCCGSGAAAAAAAPKATSSC
ncbi:MAG: arsenite efflux transporter metallochaperone ArsD [Gemmobacter sp.]